MYWVYNDIAMLSAERLCELPLEVRILVARMDIETYIRMYLWDSEFREYARKVYAVDDFIELFVVEKKDRYKKYKINNMEYRKYNDGGQQWYKNSELHKDNGPAVICANGNEYWYINGERHRINGPAIILTDGKNTHEHWFINNKYHRDDGPAMIHGGYKTYYQHDMLHRLNGPAVMYADGREEYWEYGVKIR
jgi:hypothetical protein